MSQCTLLYRYTIDSGPIIGTHAQRAPLVTQEDGYAGWGLLCCIAFSIVVCFQCIDHHSSFSLPADAYARHSQGPNEDAREASMRLSLQRVLVPPLTHHWARLAACRPKLAVLICARSGCHLRRIVLTVDSPRSNQPGRLH